MCLRVQTWSLFALSVFLPVSSGRSQEPDSYGSKWFIRPLRQTQAHPRPKEWDQTEDQDHPFLPQPLLERVLHLVSLVFCLMSLTSEEHFIDWVQVYIVRSCTVFFCTHLVSWKRQIRTAACPLRFGTGTEPPGTTSWAPCRSECPSWSKLPTVDGQWPLRSISYRKWLYAFHYVWSTCEVLWSHDPPDSDQTRMATLTHDDNNGGY